MKNKLLIALLALTTATYCCFALPACGSGGDTSDSQITNNGGSSSNDNSSSSGGNTSDSNAPSTSGSENSTNVTDNKTDNNSGESGTGSNNGTESSGINSGSDTNSNSGSTTGSGSGSNSGSTTGSGSGSSSGSGSDSGTASTGGTDGSSESSSGEGTESSGDKHTHSYTPVITPPVCSEQGYTTYICSCGDSYVDDYTTDNAHDYEDGICTRCDEADPDYSEEATQGLVFTLNDDESSYSVTGYSGDSEKIIIPAEYEGLPVTSIASGTSDENGVFSYKKLIKCIVIGRNIKTIGAYAFIGCTILQSVKIPNGVTSIGSYAFYQCSSLTSIKIPSSVTSISNFALASCASLSSIEVNENNNDYSSSGGVLFNKYQTTLICYPGGKAGEYTVPSDVSCIGKGAFAGGSITNVKMPDSVRTIEDYAFHSCDDLSRLTIGSGVTSIGSWAFYKCEGLVYVTIPASVTFIGNYAFYGCSNIEEVVFKNTSGWSYASTASSSKWTSISSGDLAKTTTAATYLTGTYAYKYWKRG